MTIKITKWVTKKKLAENTSQISEIIGMETRKCVVAVTLLVILSVEFINPLVQIIPSYDEFLELYPTSTMEFFRESKYRGVLDGVRNL